MAEASASAIELIFHQRLEHAGVLFFRLPGADLRTKTDHLDTALTDHADELAAGEFLVVTPGQIRVDGLYPCSLSALQSLMCCLSGR